MEGQTKGVRRGRDGRGKEERRREKGRGKKKKKKGWTEKSIPFSHMALLTLCLYLPLLDFVVKGSHENPWVDRFLAKDKNRAREGETANEACNV